MKIFAFILTVAKIKKKLGDNQGIDQIYGLNVTIKPLHKLFLFYY